MYANNKKVFAEDVLNSLNIEPDRLIAAKMEISKYIYENFESFNKKNGKTEAIKKIKSLIYENEIELQKRLKELIFSLNIKNPSFSPLNNHLFLLLNKEFNHLYFISESSLNLKSQKALDKIKRILMILENYSSCDFGQRLITSRSSTEFITFLLEEYLAISSDNFHIKDDSLHVCVSIKMSVKGVLSINSENISVPVNISSSLLNRAILDDVDTIKDEVIKKSELELCDKIRLFLSGIDVKSLFSSNTRNVAHILSYKELLGSDLLKCIGLDIKKIVNENKLCVVRDIMDLECTSDEVWLDILGSEKLKNKKLTFYYGETNSGKTYHSFRHLVGKNTGVYLSPLRLLAMEGYEKITAMGLRCNLVTGDNRILVDDAGFVSSTIEMLNSSAHYDVAIIDEIQMMFDERRGWAWTQALLTVNADEIVMTGSKDALPEITRIVELAGGHLNGVELNRMTSLVKYPNEIFDIEDVPDHSAIIAFSKRDVLEISKLYQEQTGKKASVIFGALTPKSRKEQSQLYCEGKTNIVIATDAISMGLNLPIENVFFVSLEKFDGNNIITLDDQLTKQIAGRAGRYGMFDKGYYGVIDCSEVILDRLMSAKRSSSPNRLSVKMPLDVFKKISRKIGSEKLSEIIDFYYENFSFESKMFKMQDKEQTINIASIIDSIDLCNDIKIEHKYKLLNAAIGHTDLEISLLKLAIKCLISASDFDRSELPKNDVNLKTLDDIKDLEEIISVIDFYLWLSYSFSSVFCNHKEEMEDLKEKISERLINFINNQH